jgi:SAM-dependent methyltransferase
MPQLLDINTGPEPSAADEHPGGDGDFASANEISLAPGEHLYGSVNQAVLARIHHTMKRVLDLGCGTGALGQTMKERMDCQVTGITASAAEAARAAQRLDRVLVQDLNHFDFAGLGEFDGVVCSHVLEHLLCPGEVLTRLRPVLAPGAKLIVALPNVLYWRQRLEFLRGRFVYTEGGLMDQTHYRFFDWETAQSLLTRSGYVLLDREADGGFPLSRRLPGIGARLDRLALRIAPGCFGFQFIFTCRAAGNNQ